MPSNTPHIMFGSVEMLIPFVLVFVLVISGLIRLRIWGRRYLEEIQRTRFEIGKLAEEVAQIRQKVMPESSSR